MFQKQDQNDVTDKAFQGQQSAIFPVKKRVYNDNENSTPQIGTQEYDMESKVAQNNQILEKNYKTHPDQINQNNILLESREQLHSRSMNSPINQTPADMMNNIYAGTKLPNTFAVSYNRETNCPLNIPSTQTNTMEMSKYTNMGYTGPEVNYTKSGLQYGRTETSPMNTLSASQKSNVPVQVTSSTTQPIDISRLCSTNITSSQRYKVEGSAAPQQAHTTFTSSSRTTELQSQNIPSDYVSDVAMSRPSYNSQTMDVDQPLGLGRNMSSFSHLVDRFSSDERLLAGLQNSSSFYTDKGLGTSQLFNKSVASNAAALPMFSQAADMAAIQQCYNQSMQGQRSMYNRQMAGIQNAATIQSDQKASLQTQVQERKKKRKSSKVGEWI